MKFFFFSFFVLFLHIYLFYLFSLSFYSVSAGLFLECPGTTAVSLRSTLQLISSPIQSLSVYDFDRSVTSLSQDMFVDGVHIRHLQFSHSHLQMLKDNSLKNLRATLESLSIVNGKLLQVRYSHIFSLFFVLNIFAIYAWYME